MKGKIGLGPDDDRWLSHRIRRNHYANQAHEPIHVTWKAGGFAKFWIDPVTLDFSEGMKTGELARAEELINEGVELIRRKWNEVHRP